MLVNDVCLYFTVWVCAHDALDPIKDTVSFIDTRIRVVKK